MPISQSYVFNKSEAFTELAFELDIRTLEELRKVTNRLTEDPDLDFENRIKDFSEQEAEKWYNKASTWINANLSAIYLRAINMQDRELNSIIDNPKSEGNPIPLARFSRHARITGELSEEAKDILSNYPSHWDSFARYEATFKEQMNRIRLPFRRSSVQAYRDIAALKMQPAFQEGAVATRKDLAQSVINEFADRGISVIDFPNRTMSVEAFANREARTYLQDVAVQGQINRATERGYDLVRINSYAGASPMCAPHQGHVYSLSGNSGQYPPLSNAIFNGSYTYGGGIYHDYSLSEDTQVKTANGWKLVRDCDASEQILSMEPGTGIFEYVGIARRTFYESDAMVQFGGDLDLRVTPDHNMYVWDRWAGFHFVEAQKLVGKKTFHIVDEDLNLGLASAELINEAETAYCLTLERNHLMMVKREKQALTGNCGHFQSTYIPGLSDPITLTDSPEEQKILQQMGERDGNRYIYQKRQELRDMEYILRKYRRRKATSLNHGEWLRNDRLIEQWENRITEHLDEYDFLKQTRVPFIDN